MSLEIIKVLPDSIANQIAAGEVIESPASLLKELVENAIDAQATAITIEIEDAAKTLMRVVDNGIGMTPMDARMAFERHATSKISSVDDLYSLHTMGFRGEALPSIAAVAQVELLTRAQGEEIGHKLVIAGSQVVQSESAMCPQGCAFTIRNLFFNVPARRRFMKSDKREMNAILRQFQRVVLVYPQIHFKLYEQGTLLHDLPPGTTLQRISALFGKRVEKSLLPVNLETPIVEVSGFTTTPQAAKKYGALQFFFVNGRYIKHPFFAKAVQNVYQDIVPQGTQSSYFIYLNVDSSRIDVNISPTKTAIKFLDEQAIFKLLMTVLRESISNVHGIPQINFDETPEIDIPIYMGRSKQMPPVPKVAWNPNYNPFKDTPLPQTETAMGSWSELGKAFESSKSTATSIRHASKKAPTQEVNYKTIPSALLRPQDSSFTEVSIPSQTEEGELLSISQVHPWQKNMAYLYQTQYLITTLSGNLAIIDIHRASFRVQYDALMKQTQKQALPSQNLLFPQLIRLSAETEPYLEDVCQAAADLGFNLSPLGNASVSILAIPAAVSVEAGTQTIQEAIEKSTAQGGDSQTLTHTISHTIATLLAEKSAITYGSNLTHSETQELLAALFSCTEPTYDPYGRLIVSVIPQEEIVKRFE